ncbi:corepressor interacting with RBPJ 1-like [Asterias rubens]|uniref:corepressor interacting with RBPJ 1-like n=1 Tax=Asterias rubens TaxID=7604 RepID=UPI0014551819|nr:corepressor interacting with RBPJ 1-like [Asterias rubens]
MGSSSRGKNSKEESRSSKRHVSSSSSEDSNSSSSSSESESESKIHFKKQKVDSATKKQRKREKKREREKKKKKETNKISKDDFYHKSTEFRLWLVEEKGKYFDQLTGAKAKNYFKKFVKRWNAGKLSKKFYRGIDHEDARASLTKYKWKFAERHTPTNIKKLDIASYDNRHNTTLSGDHMTPVADGLMKPKTFSTFGKSTASGSRDDSDQIGPSRPVQGPSRPVQGPMRPPSSSQAEYEITQEQRTKQLRKERKQFREHDKMVMEELAPRATGHEAKIEKRLLRAEQRKRKGNSPETRESFLYGGKTDIQSQVDAQRHKKEQRKEHWENKAATKAEEYRAKEKAKMSALLELARANKSENALW